MLLAFAGDGSLWAPFVLDHATDLLVRALPVRLELLIVQEWVTFVAELNCALRPLELSAFGATAGPVAAVLAKWNASSKLGELCIELVHFSAVEYAPLAPPVTPAMQGQSMGKPVAMSTPGQAKRPMHTVPQQQRQQRCVEADDRYTMHHHAPSCTMILAYIHATSCTHTCTIFLFQV
jgi:hypothetical protein